MRFLRFFLILSIFLFAQQLAAQNIDHLAGRWKDDIGNIFLLEKQGDNWQWKNEKSQIWTRLSLLEGTRYVDDDGYYYDFNHKRGNVKIINPDNERDVKSADMINFVKPSGKEIAQNPPPATPKEPNGSPRVKRDGLHGFLLGYRASVNAPIGFVIGGFGRRGGLYFGFRTSSFSRPDALTETVYRANGNHEVTDGQNDVAYTFTGYSVDTRGAITIGYIKPINDFISISAGMGYGWHRIWELYDVYDLNSGELSTVDDQAYAINTLTSRSGFEFELLGSYHFKMFNVSTGLSFVNFNSPDLVIGLGLLFN